MKYLLVFLFLLANPAVADEPTFDNLSDEDLELITQEFSAMFVHTSATPPTALGKVFGIEAGIIASAVKSKSIEEISKRVDSNAEVPFLPSAVIFGAVSVPYGFTIETNILPEVELSGLEASHYGAGVKWSLTDNLLPDLPFDLAVKTYYSKSEVSFNQVIPGSGQVDVGFENSMYGADVLFGLDLVAIQPYVGAGFVNSDSEIDGTAAADPSYSLFLDNVSRSKKSSAESMRLTAGCQFNLTLLKLTAEYNRVFDRDRLSVKLGLAF